MNVIREKKEKMKREYVRCKRYAQITQITHSKYKKKDDDNREGEREKERMREFYIIKLEYHKMRVLTKKKIKHSPIVKNKIEFFLCLKCIVKPHNEWVNNST